MKKKIGDMTASEVDMFCNARMDCKACPLDEVCMVGSTRLNMREYWTEHGYAFKNILDKEIEV